MPCALRAVSAKLIPTALGLRLARSYTAPPQLANTAMRQVVRQHRRSLVDRALGQAAPAAPTKSPPSHAHVVDADAIPSPLVSLDGFRLVTTRFEKLARSTLPKGVSELVYGDAYVVALGLSRRREVRSHVCFCSVPDVC